MRFAIVAYHPPKEDPKLKLATILPPNKRQEQEVPALLARLKLSFKNESLVYQSLSHVSNSSTFNNSRLSVYGDAIVDFTVKEYLFNNFPNLLNRSLRDVGKRLNGTEIILKVAQTIGLDVLVASQLRPDGDKELVVADAFRAFVGAVCVDQGLKASQQLCLDLIVPHVQSIDIRQALHFSHPRLTLVRLLEADNRPKPVTKILKETGRLTHLPTFLVGVFSGDTLLAQGAGFSIANAEREAIITALTQHFAVSLKTLALPQDMDSRAYISEDQIKLMDSTTPVEI